MYLHKISILSPKKTIVILSLNNFLTRHPNFNDEAVVNDKKIVNLVEVQLFIKVGLI